MAMGRHSATVTVDCVLRPAAKEILNGLYMSRYLVFCFIECASVLRRKKLSFHRLSAVQKY